MSNDTWQDQNSKYLAASLDWLRLRLKSLEPKLLATVEQEVPKLATVAERYVWPFSRKSAPANGTPALPSSGAPSLPNPPQQPKNALDDAASARDLAAQIDPPPALIQLANEFQLSPFERDVLLLCSAVEFDSGIGPLISKVISSAGREHPTFGLALSLLENAHWDALSANRPLRNAKLIEISQPGATPITLSGLRVDERILAFIKGINTLDDRLNSLITEVADKGQPDLAPSQQAICNQLLDDLHTSISEAIVPVIQLSGIDGATKIELASHTCSELGSRMFRVSVEALPTTPSETENLARLWQRETCLLPVALYIEAEELDTATNEVQAALVRLLSKSIGLVFVGVRENALKLAVPTVSFDVGKPTRIEQYQGWVDALKASGIDDEATAEQLAGQFDVSLTELNQIVSQSASSINADHPASTVLWDQCRNLTKPRLDQLAARIETKSTWDDLVLPDEQMRLMRSITDQVRERYKVYNEWGFASRMNSGFGIAALFAGESGTGKTMAANVIANELNLDLYRIDLALVVSKYIGETEKNLRKMFDAAEQGGAILFFDEADALFGKRSEVKDSHDRYANIEINYLLQRMESFSGLAILATNVKSALDPAFMRRLRFIVNFPFPTSADRKRMWQKVLPPQTPQEALDFDRLARLNVTGANIQSIALNAAFIAAGAGTSVTMPALLTAAYTELRKLDRPLTGVDLK